MKKPTNFGLRAAMLALIAWVPATFYGLSLVYTSICVPVSASICNRVPMGSHIGAIGSILIIIAIIVSIGSIIYATEAIARKEKQRVAYSALALLMVGILIYASGLFELVILKFLN